MKHKMLENIDAVIFDLDGSLVDSMWLWREIDIEYLGGFGIPLPEDLQSRIEGMRRTCTLPRPGSFRFLRDVAWSLRISLPASGRGKMPA